MTNSSEQLNKIKATIREAVSRITLVDGRPDLSDTVEYCEIISKRVLREAKYRKYLTSNEVLHYIYKTLVERLETADRSKNTVFDAVGSIQLDAYAAEAISFLEGLPYSYEVHIELPFDLPSGVDKIELTDQLCLIRTTSSPPPHARATVAELLALVPASDRTFIKISVSGYADIQISNSALNMAHRLLKQFLYLGIASGVLQHRSWTRNLDPLNAYHYRDNNISDPYRFELPVSTRLCISQIALSHNAFVPRPRGLLGMFGQPGSSDSDTEDVDAFLYRLNPAIKFLAATDAEKGYVERAVEWGFEGLANENDVNGFIQTCIGLEAILGDGTQKGTIAERLADRAAYLLANKAVQRPTIKDNVHEIYDLRSALIHGSINQISEEQSKLVTISKSYLEQLVLKEIEYLL